MAYAELTPVSGGPTVHLDAESDTGLMLGTVAGWYGTPSAKVDMTEMAGGNGAFSIRDGGILYSARTVTLGVCASGDTYAEMVKRMDSVGALSGRMVRLLIDGDDGATTATGYVQVEWDEGPMPTMDTGALTIVCPDPRRYGSAAKTAYMRPAAQSTGGLLYSSSGVLQLPLAFHGTTEAGSCTATLRNDGTSTAYPVITTGGTLRGFSIRDTAGIGTLAYGGTAWPQAPIVIDCLRRTAMCNGVDVTYKLTRRAFPSVPPGGEITLSCDGDAGSDAYICASMRDTYI